VRLSWIEIRDFRNYHEASLQVPPGLIVVIGPNAQGKTNLLEAMYYLCTLESPRVSSDLPLVRSVTFSPGAGGQPPASLSPGPSSAFLRGEAESSGGRALIEVEVRGGGQNRVQVNRSPVRRKRALRRHVRAVFCGPDDLRIVQGEPDDRRRFIDECVRTLWPAKEGTASAYERALRQRNRLLKDWPGPAAPPGLEGWDAEVVGHGAALTSVRAGAVAEIAGRASQEFQRLSGQTAEALGVEYRPSVEPAGTETLEAAFRRRLDERSADELIRRTTLVGPHRDDLGLRVQGLTARGFASHGEAWGAALSLRLALGRAVASELGEDPVVFRDDPFSALGPERRRRLAAGLGGRGQVLIAIPDESQLPEETATVWCVREGQVAAA